MRWACLLLAAAVVPAPAGKFTAQEAAPLLKLAARTRRNALIRFGGQWCGSCGEWQKVWSDQKTAAFLNGNFVPIRVDVAVEEVRRLASENGVRNGTGDHPLLMIVSPDGTVLAAQSGSEFMGREGYDPGKVRKFAGRYKPKPPTAAQRFDLTLEAARESGRNVFVIFGATWCEPCHQLRYLFRQSRVAAVLDRNYLFLEYDIDDGAVDTVEPRVGRGHREPIPWYAVVSPEGKVLAASTKGASTIGVPSDMFARGHFMGMLRSTARDILEEEFKAIENAVRLNEAAPIERGPERRR